MEPKNCLIQYQGGGYDGCYWEWNFFYVDEEGKFFDIFSSGRCGCDTEEKAIEYLDKELKSHFYLIHLDNEDEIKEFSKETNPSLVKGILKWFEKYNTVNFYAICSECGSQIECHSDTYFDDKYNPSVILCEQCHSDGYCSCCESYVGEEKLDYEIDEEDEISTKLIDDLAQEYGNVCEDCFNYNVEQEKNQRVKDTFHKSLLTGEPDIFSEDNRTYWEN